MDYKDPNELERYAFLWSEVRLVIAAVALLLGGIPPVLLLFPAVGIVLLLLKLSWLVSGVTSAYLLYRWYTNKQMVFGGKDTKDIIAFFVMVVSGLNLGFVGLAGTNIGMSIASSRPVFAITALAYLVAAGYLYKRWKAKGEKVF